MDLDMGQARAFVTVADHLHFGLAAKDLFLTQQALSARISRLEASLGVKLFHRGAHGVRLTTAGQRFLNPARQVLIAGEHAVAQARNDDQPLRMNVWGHLFFPAQPVRELTSRVPELKIEVTTCPNMLAAVHALQQNEIDVALGRVTDWAKSWSGTLARRLIRLDPMAVIVNVEHPLASRTELNPNDLRTTQLWLPAPLESLDFLRQFVNRFHLNGRFGGVNLGPYYIINLLYDEPDQAAVVPAHLNLPEDLSVRMIPLVNPTPLYGSSLIWRKDGTCSGLERLLQTVDVAMSQRSWLRYSAEHNWLPEAEHSDVRSMAVLFPGGEGEQ
jgi:DNA-binding transcriptional LysR family regulator